MTAHVNGSRPPSKRGSARLSSEGQANLTALYVRYGSTWRVAAALRSSPTTVESLRAGVPVPAETVERIEVRLAIEAAKVAS